MSFSTYTHAKILPIVYALKLLHKRKIDFEKVMEVERLEHFSLKTFTSILTKLTMSVTE